MTLKDIACFSFIEVSVGSQSHINQRTQLVSVGMQIICFKRQWYNFLNTYPPNKWEALFGSRHIVRRGRALWSLLAEESFIVNITIAGGLYRLLLLKFVDCGFFLCADFIPYIAS